jgi:hypothetical protein
MFPIPRMATCLGGFDVFSQVSWLYRRFASGSRAGLGGAHINEYLGLRQ